MLGFIFKQRKLKKELKQSRNHIAGILHVDDDILSDSQKQDLTGLCEKLQSADPAKAADARQLMSECNAAYRQIIPPKRFSTIREYADVLAVAMAVAFGIRGLFLQPFKIPTSSMQPTLFGIHYIAKKGNHNPALGVLPQPFDFLLFAARRAKLEIKDAGELNPESMGEYVSAMIFNNTAFNIGRARYTLPGTPDKVAEYSGLRANMEYRPGNILCDGWLSLGDHLFVDRFSMHWTGLNRGDVIVFNTEKIVKPSGELLAATGYYYIKRLVGLPGETLKIINNRLFVKPVGGKEFKFVVELSEKFKKLYSGRGGYHGHLNVTVAGPGSYLASPDEEFAVPKECYFMMGDNSFFSSDGRTWGVVPRKNIVGKACFIFWPLSRRWGMVDRQGPLPEPTQNPDGSTFRAMRLQ